MWQSRVASGSLNIRIVYVERRKSRKEEKEEKKRKKVVLANRSRDTAIAIVNSVHIAAKRTDCCMPGACGCSSQSTKVHSVYRYIGSLTLLWLH